MVNAHSGGGGGGGISESWGAEVVTDTAAIKHGADQVGWAADTLGHQRTAAKGTLVPTPWGGDINSYTYEGLYNGIIEHADRAIGTHETLLRSAKTRLDNWAKNAEDTEETNREAASRMNNDVREA
ncbi:hypothetical protein [Nocardioides litoris]|uniref:hypothetical protein n=1 Tax=Nocardioides litoris TaxID=1926648 RepID=UPI00111FB90F|nr:hypothetical protein [Nocardioides litoris]